MKGDIDGPNSRRRWYQFSLKSFVVLVLVASAGFGWVATKVKDGRRQRQAYEELMEKGAKVIYGFESKNGQAVAGVEKPATTWLRKQLGDDFFDDVVVVQCPGNVLKDVDMALLEAFPQLEFLDLTGRPVTDQGVAHLAGLTEMRDLDLWNSRITAEGLRAVRKMTKLERLSVGCAPIQDEGLTHLQGLVDLNILYLSNTEITDDGLRHLTPLKKLEKLTLYGTSVTDAGLVHLRDLPALRELNLGRTAVTRDAVDRLSETLPECTMIY